MTNFFDFFDDELDKEIIFDPTLARGLDYYTGLIYEVEYTDKKIMSSSIAAGGRYDKMIDKLSNKQGITAIGVSFGIERIVKILEHDKNLSFNMKPLIYVATVGENMAKHKIKLCLELRKKGLYTEISYLEKPKMRNQFKHVFNEQIPFMIVIGESEIKKNTVMIKDINKNEQKEIRREDIYDYIKKLSI